METSTSLQRSYQAAAICGAFMSSFLFLFPVAPAQATDVLTYHNDNGRTGQNLNEEILTPANVNTNHFGKLWVLPADGLVDAEPLYAAGVSIPQKGLRNVVFVATEHDSVYAYDADSTNLFWQVSLLGTNEVPSDDRGCSQVTPEIGITATPVIDRQLGPNGTMFVVAMSKLVTNNTTNYFQRLHALDLATGTNRLPAVTVAAKYPGTGDNHVGTNVVFDPAQYKERCGLLLLNGVIYTAWASHCDIRPYTGWIIGYDEHTLAQTSVLNITPNGSEAAIWMSGAGLAADAASNIYFLAGNGTFETTLTTNGFPNQGDYGNAFMKLSTVSNQLAVADYFTMFNTVSESAADTDLGSGGALVLPDMVDGQGNTRQLAVGAGKGQQSLSRGPFEHGQVQSGQRQRHLSGTRRRAVRWSVGHACVLQRRALLRFRRKQSAGVPVCERPACQQLLANRRRVRLSRHDPEYFRQRQFQWHRLGDGKHFSSHLARLCRDQPCQRVL